MDDHLDTIEFLDGKSRRARRQGGAAATAKKLLITVPGISYYPGLLISSEIADIDRSPTTSTLLVCGPGAGCGNRLRLEPHDAEQDEERPAELDNDPVHVGAREGCDSSITRFYTELAKRRGERSPWRPRGSSCEHVIMLKEEQAFRLDG